MNKLFVLMTCFLLLGHFISADEMNKLKRATFSMYCYWTGEAALGSLRGVKSSKIGSLDHKEVVEVFYNPKETNLGEMIETLKKKKSFYSLIYRTEEEKQIALTSLSQKEVSSGSKNVNYIEAKHSLRIRYPQIYKLKLTEEQALRLNTWAYFGGPMPRVLTPKQIKKMSQ